MQLPLDPGLARELREAQLARLTLLREQERLVKDFGLKYYRPHAKQDAFHRAGKYKRRAVFAGNRFGKSDCGAAEDCAQTLGERPWYPESDTARREGIPQRPQKGLIITTDWDKVNSVFVNDRGDAAEHGKLWKFLPRGFIVDKKRNHSGVYDTLIGQNGSSITFDVVKAFKLDPQSSESDNYDWIHIDEPCPEKMFDANARGLMDRHGQAYFTLTPLREPWIYDYFFPDDDAQRHIKDGEVVAKALVVDNRMWSITGSVWDNTYLTAESINDFLNDLEDQGERECRESGIPLQFAGLIYKEFMQHVHLMNRVPTGWEDYDEPPTNWPVYLQLDPHPQTPTAGLLCTVDKESGRKIVFNEIWESGDCEEVVKVFKKKLGHRYLARALSDPSCFNEDKLTRTCWADDFAHHGLVLQRAVKDLERGIKAVKLALKSRDKDGFPMWMFSPYLRRFLWEIKRWNWSEKDNKPVDKNDHTMECLYRMVLDDPQWCEPSSYTYQDPQDEPITGLTDDERFLDKEQLYNL